VKESIVDQGEQIFDHQLCLLPFLGRIGARSGRRRRCLADIFSFTTVSLFSISRSSRSLVGMSSSSK
jgi:hypothetical protein